MHMLMETASREAKKYGFKASQPIGVADDVDAS